VISQLSKLDIIDITLVPTDMQASFPQDGRLDGVMTVLDTILPSSILLTNVSINNQRLAVRGFADILKGTWEGSPVALKRLRTYTTMQPEHHNKILRRLCAEVLIRQGLQHRYVQPLLGVTLLEDSSLPCIVSPWQCHGNLLEFLKHRNADSLWLTDIVCVLSPCSLEIYRRRLPQLLRCSEGLGYLHSRGVIHGDVKSVRSITLTLKRAPYSNALQANILVDDGGNPRLTNFGLALATDALRSLESTYEAGTPRFMAPELLNPDVVSARRTTAGDAYAFACLILEVSHTRDLRLLF
jgi:serine/threonine protein kinase